MSGMLAIPTNANEDGIWYRILTAGDDGAVYSWTDEDFACRMDADEDFAALSRGLAPGVTDPATAGCLMLLLGSEAWRVWYSRSAREQTPETPWVADIQGGDATRHATQGEAAVAVAMGLGRWGGR